MANIYEQGARNRKAAFISAQLCMSHGGSWANAAKAAETMTPAEWTATAIRAGQRVRGGVLSPESIEASRAKVLEAARFHAAMASLPADRLAEAVLADGVTGIVTGIVTGRGAA